MILEFNNLKPKLANSVFIADNASLIGDVRLGNNANIWFGCVIRGDIHYCSIGEDSNIQDLSIMHVTDELPCIVQDRVVCGHGVILHGCIIEDEVLLGMGCIVLNGAVVGKGSIIAAGSVIKENAKIPPYSLVAGVPGKIMRQVSEEEVKNTVYIAKKYVELSNEYKKK